MSINENIQKAIKESLPEAVAGELKEYLEETEDLKEENKWLRKENDELKEENGNLRNLKSRLDSVELREKQAEKLNQDLNLREAVLKVREEHVEERVNEIRNLTQTVFRSNRMNYNLDLSIPYNVPTDGYGNPNYGNVHHETVSAKIQKDDSQDQ